MGQGNAYKQEEHDKLFPSSKLNTLQINTQNNKNNYESSNWLY